MSCLRPATITLPTDQEREHFTEVFSNYSSFELWFSGNVREVPINQIHITGDPEEAANSSIIIIVVPAFAHEPFFSKLAPYLKENTTLAAIPAKGGIEFQVEHILCPKNVVRSHILDSAESDILSIDTSNEFDPVMSNPIIGFQG